MKLVERVLDKQHPQLRDALGEYRDQVDISCVTSGRETSNLASVSERIRDRQTNRYLMSTISSKDGQPGDTAVFFLPGAFGTSPGNAHTIAAVYREALSRGIHISVAAAISSSFSRDTLDYPLSSKTDVRSATQAMLMKDLLQEHPSSKVWILGHSHGGLEGMHVGPILRNYLEEDNLETNINLILVQSAGLFRQNPIDFLRRYFAYPLVDEAARFQYPDEVGRTEMNVLKSRIERTLHGADLRKEGVPFRAYLRVIRSGLEELNPVPDEVRKAVHDPVGIMWGENDTFFPASLAIAEIEKRRQRRGTALFPNSPQVKTVIEPNWPHLGLVVKPGHFANLALDLMQNMQTTS